MEHDVKFLNAEEAVATAILALDIRKEEYTQVHTSEKEEQREPRRKHTCCL
jgi:hypothetical protein